MTVTDKKGNSWAATSAYIYLDHSNPVIHGLETTDTDWTNRAPVISVNGTDYLSGTSYTGSGMASMVVYDDAGREVARGSGSVAYTLADKYEGIHTWKIVATDNVDHASTAYVTTKYDITKPGIDGTEITKVIQGMTVSGYCQDNVINQHTDDEARRSVNNPNVTSGLRSVMLYKVVDGHRYPIYSSTTNGSWASSDTHSYFNIYYDDNVASDLPEYYVIAVSDHAGNITEKKLTTQRYLLTTFHTSIDRSTYNR
ncbi:MAG: hypothetical protein SO361_09310 [Lachnospira sp.]|nr:hypothetical protein [Lachnospira sp.]